MPFISIYLNDFIWQIVALHKYKVVRSWVYYYLDIH